MPDFVNETLTFINDNWNTSNYAKKPILIDRRDGRWVNEDRRTTSVDLAVVNNTVVGVSDTPFSSYTPQGVGWSHQEAEEGVSIRVEGLHTDEHGTIADGSEWRNLTDEVKRTLTTERKRPFGEYEWLEVREADGRASDHTDYYRTDFDAAYTGIAVDLD